MYYINSNRKRCIGLYGFECNLEKACTSEFFEEDPNRTSPKDGVQFDTFEKLTSSGDNRAAVFAD